MALSDQVYEGEFKLGDHDSKKQQIHDSHYIPVCLSFQRFYFSVYYASGTSIAQFPKSGLVLAETLKDQGHEVVTGESVTRKEVPVLGMFEPELDEGGGRIVLYGDSNCFDNSHMQQGTLQLVFFNHRYCYMNCICWDCCACF